MKGLIYFLAGVVTTMVCTLVWVETDEEEETFDEYLARHAGEEDPDDEFLSQFKKDYYGLDDE